MFAGRSLWLHSLAWDLWAVRPLCMSVIQKRCCSCGIATFGAIQRISVMPLHLPGSSRVRSRLNTKLNKMQSKKTHASFFLKSLHIIPAYPTSGFTYGQPGTRIREPPQSPLLRRWATSRLSETSWHFPRQASGFPSSLNLTIVTVP